MTQNPSIGRVVHFVIPTGYCCAGEIRPAIVVRAHNPVTAEIHPGMSNLSIICDGPNDARGAGDPVPGWFGSVLYDPDGGAGTWHWPERV